MHRRWLVVGALSLFVATGCNGSPDPTPDADAGGGDADTGTGLPPEAPPVIPWIAAGEPPVAELARPCPAGWSERLSESGVRLCDPVPIEAPTCGETEALFAGTATCEPIGTACPAGDFPDDVSASGTVRYVLASAAAGGDGTRARPFARISDAAGFSRPGDLIAVGKGRYDEVVLLPPGVTVRGACVAETVLVQTATLPLTVYANPIVILYPDITIENLQIADAERSGITIRQMGTATISDVLLQNVRKDGIEVTLGTSATIRNVVIRDMRLRAESSSEGYGVAIVGATARLERLVIERATDIGIVGAQGSDVTIVDTAIRDMQASTSGDGRGIVGDRSTFTLTRLSVNGAPTTGIGFNESIARFEDVVVDRAFRWGVSASPGSRLEGAGVSIRNAGSRALITSSAVVLLDDVTIVDASGADSPGGVVIGGVADEQSVLRRVFVEGQNIGVFVDDATWVRIEDLRVTRMLVTRSTLGYPVATGILAQGGAILETVRAVIEDGKGNTVEVKDPFTQLTLEDAVIRRTSSSSPALGTGVIVFTPAEVTLNRVLVEEIQGMSILLHGLEARGHATDLVVRDGFPLLDVLPPFGVGLWIQQGATFDLERGLVQSTFGYGIAVHDGSTLTANGLWVLGTRLNDCERVSCTDEVGGHAIAVGGVATVSDFQISDADSCGILVFDTGIATLTHGTVEGTAIGACVQSEMQTLEMLMDDVRYVDNGTNLDSTSLPVPDVYGI